MKYFLIISLFSHACLATTQEELVEIIKERCSWEDSSISFDKKEDCMLNYINCSIVSDGKIDLKNLPKCLAKKRS